MKSWNPFFNRRPMIILIWSKSLSDASTSSVLMDENGGTRLGFPPTSPVTWIALPGCQRVPHYSDFWTPSIRQKRKRWENQRTEHSFSGYEIYPASELVAIEEPVPFYISSFTIGRRSVWHLVFGGEFRESFYCKHFSGFSFELNSGQWLAYSWVSVLREVRMFAHKKNECNAIHHKLAWRCCGFQSGALGEAQVHQSQNLVSQLKTDMQFTN